MGASLQLLGNTPVLSMGHQPHGPGSPKTLCPPQVQQQAFREKFREKAPFLYTDPDPYKSLNKVGRVRMLGQGLGPAEGDACPCHAAQPCSRFCPLTVSAAGWCCPREGHTSPGQDTRPQGRTRGLRLSPFLPPH